MTETLFVDNSILSAVAKCDTMALVRYALGYATLEEQATLRSGTGWHRCAEVWFKGGTKAEALTAFANEYQAWAEEHVPGDDRLAWINVDRIASYWLDTHPLHALPYKVQPDHVEIGFNFPLTDAGDIVFCGRLDALAELQGAIYVVEHKSTGMINATWLKKWWLDSQLSGYVWAARQHFNAPVAGVILNGIEFKKLPGSDRKCPEHKVPYIECGHLHAKTDTLIVDRGPEAIEDWKRTALALAARYRDFLDRFAHPKILAKLLPYVAQQGTFNGSCSWCAMFDWCKGGRKLPELASNYVVEHWSPLEHAINTRDESGRKP